MLKIGIIGLGDIAHKAYLPLISKHNIEIHLYSRTATTLENVRTLYRLNNVHHSLESLIESGIKGAFVHAPTGAHFEIVEQLIANNIHVYVDKPITYDYASSEKLISLAAQQNVTLMVGFNRRYAPSYLKARELSLPNMIVMQKNRKSLPDDIRAFIFDDFIHVIDTLLFLFPYVVKELIVTGKKEKGLLFHVVIQLTSAEGAVAIGIMNRDSGTIEEKLEITTATEKRVVYNVSDVVVLQDKNETKLGVDDWQPTLQKRGFEGIINDFLHRVGSGTAVPQADPKTLQSHKICEEIVQELSSMPS